jgi:hypothetical protein
MLPLHKALQSITLCVLSPDRHPNHHAHIQLKTAQGSRFRALVHTAKDSYSVQLTGADHPSTALKRLASLNDRQAGLRALKPCIQCTWSGPNNANTECQY